MPNADTHDRITYLLAPVTFVGAQYYWQRPEVSLIATLALLFAGLMFGPDLDLHSRPYLRWGALRFIWKPYQAALPHRSTLSHGPLLGTVIRILYFLAIFMLLASAILYIRKQYVYGMSTTFQAEYGIIRRDLLTFWRQTDKQYFWAAFAGLWFGALSHTLADITWSYLKSSAKGRRRKRR